jgi:hypothetical protein
VWPPPCKSPQQSSNSAPEAEACFHQALDIARQQQDKQDDARELLTDVYGWFTEGFDTHDLKEATALLKALT